MPTNKERRIQYGFFQESEAKWKMVFKGSDLKTSRYNGRCSQTIVTDVYSQSGRHLCGTHGTGTDTCPNDGGRKIRVHLKGVGTFYYSCQSKKQGVDTPEEVSPQLITDIKVRFIPEYSRGQRGQVTERTLIDPNIEWVEIGKI